MATLHLIHAAAQGSDALARCVAGARSGDVILFYGRGVLAATTPIAGTAKNVRLFAHRADALALHVADRISAPIRLIDDEEFVDLVVSTERSVAWL